MTKVSFKVSARTARLIGQENFANAEGAVIELVKNCYDADAKNGIVFFDNTDSDPSNHRIIIIDNGHGMTKKIIEDHWMMIGTDNKEIDYETKSGRIKTGAKGIGRFALDRLGSVAEMYTLPEDFIDGYYWKVKWSDFEPKGTDLSNVEADLEEANELNLKSKILELTNELPPLKKAIDSIDFNHGTILVISDLNELWEDSSINKLFNNLEVLIPPKEQRVFAIHLFSRNSPDQFGELSSMYFDDFDYRVSASFNNDKEQKVKLSIRRNELAMDELKTRYNSVFEFELMKVHPYDLKTFESEEIVYEKNVTELIKGSSENINSELIKKVGPFSFSFYFLKNTQSDDKTAGEFDIDKKYPYQSFNSANRKAWLDRFGGIKIFRDDFRVRPYGEPGNDWLDLGKRYAKSPGGPGQRLGGYRVRPNQISGTIHISRIHNPEFRDKSNREGIRDNEVFELFKELLKGIIAELERDRNTIMYSLSELYNEREARAKANREAEELAHKILKVADEEKSEDPNIPKPTLFPERQGPTEEEIALAKNVEDKRSIIHEKDEEIRLLRGLAGTGLIVASFAHELRGLRTLLASRSIDLKGIITEIIDKDIIKTLPKEDNPITILNQMREQDLHIKHWLDYSLTALKKDRRTRANIDIAEYFKSFKSNWVSALNRRKVSLTVNIELSRTVYLKAFLIDLDTIFNNLLANSLDSFKRRKDLNSRKVSVNVKENKNEIVVNFSDNGAGLSKDFSEPTDIFLPFETSKVDRRGNKIGTGMGMYLVKTILDEYRGEIKICDVKEGFELEILIPLRKQAKADD